MKEWKLYKNYKKQKAIMVSEHEDGSITYVNVRWSADKGAWVIK